MKRGVGQIYAMAVMLALMISTLLVGLGMEGSILQSEKDSIGAIEANQRRELEKLGVSQDGGKLTVENIGTVPVTISFIHTSSADEAVNQVVQPGATWMGLALGSSPNSVITSLGNVFSPDANSSQPAEEFPSGASLYYSPLAPDSYFIFNPMYSSDVGAVTKAEISGSADWTAVYPPDYPFNPTSFSTGMLSSSDSDYTLFYTQYYYAGYYASVTPYELQAPQADRFTVSSAGPISFKSSTLGFLAISLRYLAAGSEEYSFWNSYTFLSPAGNVVQTYDPGAFPSRGYEAFFGEGAEAFNGSDIAEFGFGTSYYYETTGSFPTDGLYPYSSMYIRVLGWGAAGLSTVAMYDVSSNYPAYPYLADDVQAWAGAECVYGNLMAIRISMRSPTNAYVLLDVYDLNTGELLARKLLFNGSYTSNTFPYQAFHEGFLDSDHLVLEDGVGGSIEILSIPGNLSVLATASSLPSASRVGSAVPLVPTDYTTITDFYIVPGASIVYPTYAGAYFYDYDLSIIKTISFQGFEPQPKSPNPLVLVSNSTIVALVAGPDGQSYVKVFGP